MTTGISATRLFWQQFRRDFFHMGAVLPSSPALARAGVVYLAHRQPGPVRVLEAGAGTGSFTREIVPLLQPGDTLDVVELSPDLMAVLRRRFAIEPKFQPRPGVTINLINADIRTIAAGQYDYIVFSLPLTNFPPALVEEILGLMINRLKPGGVFSFVKYIFISRFKYLFSPAAAKANMDANLSIIQSFAANYQIAQRTVIFNVPPTWVFYWQKPHGN